MGKVLSELEELDGESARRIRDIEKKVERKLATQELIHSNEVNYKMHKRIPKSTFEEIKSDNERLYSSLDDEIEGMISDMTENL